MNMKKYFSFAIVVFLMAVPLVLTSCGKDNILDDVEELFWMTLKSFSRS